MTVTTTSAATAGDATIVVTGTGSATHSVSVSLTVTSGGSNTAPSLVQSASSTATAPSTAPATTLTKPTSAGDLLVLSVSLYAGTTNHITSITDSAGNTWVRVNAWSTASHNSDGEMWYAADVAATSGLTVTAHVVTAASMAFEVDEFSGIAITSPLDQSAGASTTGTTASSGPLTPAASGALLIGFSAGHASTQTMAVSASGFTAQPQRISTGPVVTLVTGFRVLAAPEATSFSASFAAAMYWAAGLAVFRPAP
jgi:hypothetical protein